MPSQPTSAHPAPAEDDASYRPDPGRETRLTIDSFLQALAAFDATWIEVIDPSRHGFSFERPATIGTGGATCPFTFTRDAGPES